MAWWDDVYDAVTDAVDAVAEVVEDVVETTGDAVTDFVETAGNAAEDGLNAVGGAFPILQGVTGWLGGIAAGATNLVGAAIKAVFGIVGGVVAGLIRVIGGILLWNAGLVVEGWLGIGSSIAGAVIMVAGTLLSLIQRLAFLQNNERALTKAERDLLTRVFYNTVSLYNVRLIEGWCGAFGINNRAFTLGNTIYLKDNDPSTRPDVLVHECVHVWQYQNVGSRYTMDALGAQATYGDSAYDWQAELTRGRGDWVEFNKEAQAALIEDIWTDGTLTVNGATTIGSGSFYDLQDVQTGFDNGTAEFKFDDTDYTDLATAAVASLRGRINVRWSRAF